MSLFCLFILNCSKFNLFVMSLRRNHESKFIKFVMSVKTSK